MTNLELFIKSVDLTQLQNAQQELEAEMEELDSYDDEYCELDEKWSVLAEIESLIEVLK